MFIVISLVFIADRGVLVCSEVASSIKVLPAARKSRTEIGAANVSVPCVRIMLSCFVFIIHCFIQLQTVFVFELWPSVSMLSDNISVCSYINVLYRLTFYLLTCCLVFIIHFLLYEINVTA